MGPSHLARSCCSPHSAWTAALRIAMQPFPSNGAVPCAAPRPSAATPGVTVAEAQPCLSNWRAQGTPRRAPPPRRARRKAEAVRASSATRLACGHKGGERLRMSRRPAAPLAAQRLRRGADATLSTPHSARPANRAGTGLGGHREAGPPPHRSSLSRWCRPSSERAGTHTETPRGPISRPLLLRARRRRGCVWP